MTPSIPRLRLSLQGVADLARVKRPVVSVWRTRFAASDLPFPAPIGTERGREFFDADAVAHWLVDTGRGNNRDAVTDAPAHATLGSSVIAEGETPLANPSPAGAGLDELTAMIALYAGHGAPLSGLTAVALHELARSVDPADRTLFHEVMALGDRAPSVASFVDVLVDGAYSPEAAFETVLATRFREGRRELTRSSLTDAAVDLVARTALAVWAGADGVSPGDSVTVVDPTGASADLIIALLAAVGEARDVTVMTAEPDEFGARLMRRRLLAHRVLREGFAVEGGRRGLDAGGSEMGGSDSGGSDDASAISGPAVHVAMFPSPATPDQSAAAVLATIESIALRLGDAQRAVFIGPASLLCDGRLDGEASIARSSVLRSGRLSAIVRLPAGLLTTSPRKALALWVLGPPPQNVSLAERWMLVADLTAQPLTRSAVADLVSDLVAGTGDRRSVRSHSFRFARAVLTSTLLAQTGSLVARPVPVQHSAVAASDPDDARRRGAALLVRVDELLAAQDAPIEPVRIAASVSSDIARLAPSTIGDLIRARHLRYLAGARLDPDDLAAPTGYPVIGVPELTAGGPVRSARRIDRIVFSNYPAARLTEPGDVVFCTGPSPSAWVDRDGSSVVLYPARVLRISRSDPAGLVPEVLAGDIAAIGAQPAQSAQTALTAQTAQGTHGASGGPVQSAGASGGPVQSAGARSAAGAAQAWRQWRVRRVLLGQRGVLVDALRSIQSQQAALRARLEQLDDLDRLLTRGVTSGALTLSEPETGLAAPKSQNTTITSTSARPSRPAASPRPKGSPRAPQN